MDDLKVQPVEQVRNARVMSRRDLALYAVLTVLQVGAFTVFAVRWSGFDGRSEHLVTFAALSVPIVLGAGLYEARWLTLPLMQRPLTMPPATGLRVGVATTFVPAGESLEMLEETVRGLIAMDHPHDTWVLDEGDDERVRALCARLGAHHYSRLHDAEHQTASGTFERGSKHGNYNAWLHDHGFEAYDVVVGFDPDHVPHSDYLLRTLGYLRDPQVGYVQAAQVYYNQPASLVARGAAEETYVYYSSVQMTSYSVGYPIVTGCHHLHRTTALREVGGFAAHEADDLLITIHYRAAGWRGVYVPEVLAQGITPVDWAGYLTQQRRWARSVLDVKLRVYPGIAGRLPVVERLASLLHGLYYLHGIAVSFGLLLLTWTLVTGRGSEAWQHLYSAGVLLVVAALQLCDLYRQRFFLLPDEETGLHWRSGLLRLAKWPSVLLAIVDAARPRRTAYAMTPKTRQPAQRSLIWLPHGIVSLVLVVALTISPSFDVPHSLGAAVLAGTLAVLSSTLTRSPEPYDDQLSAMRRSRVLALNQRLRVGSSPPVS